MIRRPRNLAAELFAFAALAGLAAFRWAALVEPLPAARVVAIVLLGCGTGLLLVRCGRAGGRMATFAAAVAVVAAGFIAALVIAGLPAHFLSPSAWGELRGNLNAGLEGVNLIDVPFAGADEWTRLGLLLAIPLTVIFAAAMSFWPSPSQSREHGELRPVGLAMLLTLYGVSVTWLPPGSELAWGIPVLIAVAAWIWLPRIEPRRALAAVAAVAAATVLAVPLAAWADTGDALFDYGEWPIFGGGGGPARFDWNHSYDPLDWPDEGTEVFRATEASTPHFWRTAVLDQFDGAHWFDDPAASPESTSEVPGDDVFDEIVRAHADWIDSVDVTITGLETTTLIAPGGVRWQVPQTIAPVTRDGTIMIAGDPLGEGDSYALQVYSPNPSPAGLRRITAPMPPGLDEYRTLTLPAAGGGETTLTSADWQPGLDDAELAGAVAGTSFEGVYDLARELTADATTRYDAVAAIGSELTSGSYEYTREPPPSDDPLPDFLLTAKQGYCQQFSGSMALMLRMIGVPARVSSGFATGRRIGGDSAGLNFSVRDTDAHSWVEVYFPSVGWVTFDPTPTSSEARTGGAATAFDRAGSPQLFGEGNPTQRSLAPDSQADQEAEAEKQRRKAAEESAGGRARDGAERGGNPLAIATVIAGLLLALAIAAIVAIRRRRRMLGERDGTRQARELIRALPRLGWSVPPRATLLELEALLSGAGPDATSYVARLRAHRFAGFNSSPPGPADRRRLRAALVHGDGIAGRIKSFLAIPPGGPA